jgi:uncharacterized protein YbaR (Trm112 family)
MKKRLTEILICPLCLSEERQLKEKIFNEIQGDIVEGELICGKCGKVYPIHEGIAFLQPEYPVNKNLGNRYETDPVISSYLWSHYGDLLKDDEASDAYLRWAGLMGKTSGFCLDIGSAVGRFTFEMSKKNRFVVGIDNSISFVRRARELMINRRMKVSLVQEGKMTREEIIILPGDWETGNIEFIVADALALPFCSGAFSSLSSLNLIDKVAVPIKHLTEMNRVAQKEEAQLLFSDPFSWSEEVAKEEDWLGGKVNGSYSGRGMENIIALLQDAKAPILPAWKIEEQGYIWWKIRKHDNYFELIRSCFVKAGR